MANSTTASGGAPLTGGKVLAILLTFFVVVFGVNGLMMYDAVSTFRGQTNEHPYESGVKFNSELAAAAAQNALGWKVDMIMTDGVRVTFRDAEGRALEGLAVSGVFAAPADTKRDRVLAFAEASPGVYVAAAAAPASGAWNVHLTAKRDDATVFQSLSRVTLEVAALASRNDEHWRVGLNLIGRNAFVTFRDTEGRPVEGLGVSGVFVAPKGDRARDRAFTATEPRPGEYAIPAEALVDGSWDLALVARRGDATPFESRNGVEIR